MLLLVVGSCGAQAKFYVELDTLFEISTLARNSKTLPNFSISSSGGYRGILENEVFINNWMTFNLGGEFAQYTYEIASTRTLIEPEFTQTNYFGGFRLRFGNVMFDLRYMQKQFFTLEDQDTVTHELKVNEVGVPTLGMQVAATSRYWDLMMRLMMGAGSGEEVTVDYTVTASALMLFGRKNKTVFETITTRNIKQNEYLFGLIALVREEAYTANDFEYGVSDLSIGLLFKMQIN